MLCSTCLQCGGLNASELLQDKHLLASEGLVCVAKRSSSVCEVCGPLFSQVGRLSKISQDASAMALQEKHVHVPTRSYPADLRLALGTLLDGEALEGAGEATRLKIRDDRRELTFRRG